jgi:hypothetical protein
MRQSRLTDPRRLKPYSLSATLMTPLACANGALECQQSWAPECHIARLSANFTRPICRFVPALGRSMGPPGAGVAMGRGLGVISFVSQKTSDSRCSRLC